MSNTSTEIDDGDFVLKHRVAGAAFLLFFGALVLPWLLGPPSNAVEVAKASKLETQITEQYQPKDLEDEVLAQLQDELVEDETVYISKVTPAGFAKVSETVDSSEKLKAQKLRAQKLAAKKAEQKKQQAELVKAKSDAANKEAEAKKEIALKLKADQQKNVAQRNKQQSDEDKALAKVREAQANSDKQQAAAQQLASALEAESGWIVQVGVFTDKAGANKMSSSLSDNGFNPSSTTVDTNLGSNTGTRVWLGPFNNRDEASQMKKSLAVKTGRSGFVRAYP